KRCRDSKWRRGSVSWRQHGRRRKSSSGCPRRRSRSCMTRRWSSSSPSSRSRRLRLPPIGSASSSARTWRNGRGGSRPRASRASEVVSGLVSFRSTHMYDLRLSPEQLQIRDTVRDFVAEVIKPLALKPERMEARARPLLVETLDQASQMGLRTLALSEDRGGAGADSLTCCIVTEELAVGDPDVAAVLAQTATLGHALFDRVMTAEQRAHFLPAFL